MVTTKTHILPLLIACLALAGCEVIRENERLIDMEPMPIATNAKHHLLIEYTGVNCVNCPRAAEAAHELEENYPNLIVVAMHPASNPFTQAIAKYDYTCPEADVYYKYMGGLPTTPFPTGNLDFTADEDDTYLQDQTSWATDILLAQADTAVVSISAAATLEAGKVTVRTTLTMLEEGEANMKVLLWVIENNIVGAQNMPDGSFNPEYTHQHMLRASLNGDWGQSVQLKHYEPLKLEGTYSLNEKWVYSNCRIVVVVLDEQTKELVNALEIGLE